jgi:hypothetical protein
MTTIGRTAAFKAQAAFARESKIKVGKDIWSEGVAGSRFYAKVLSKNPATVQQAIDLAVKLDPPFTPSAVQGHLRWLYTAGELEVDGKSYPVAATVVKPAKPEAPKDEPTKVEAKPEPKPEPKAEAKPARKRTPVKAKKAA